MGELLWTNQLADPAVLTQMLGCLYPIDFLIFFFQFYFQGLFYPAHSLHRDTAGPLKYLYIHT